MNRSALVLLIPLLAACGIHSNRSNDENVSINADGSGDIAFDVPFIKGRVKVPGSMMHNGDFDIDGVRLMPGSEVNGFNVDARGKAATVNIGFTAPASPEDVRSYYVDQFKEKGVDVALAGDAVSGRTKDGEPFVIHVTPAAGGSQGKIEIHSDK